MFKRKTNKSVLVPSADELMYWSDHPFRSIHYVFAASLCDPANRAFAKATLVLCLVLGMAPSALSVLTDSPQTLPWPIMIAGIGMPIAALIIMLYFTGRMALIQAYKNACLRECRPSSTIIDNKKE